MPKLVLLKKSKDGVTRDELIDFLKTAHGPHNAQLPGVDYTLSVQVDPENKDSFPEVKYYDSGELVPIDPSASAYDTLEIHEFETMEALMNAHSTDHAEQGKERLRGYSNVEEEIAFVVRDASIED